MAVLHWRIQCKLGLGKQFAPISLLGACVATQDLFHAPVESLSQAIRLWMVARRHGHTCVQCLGQGLPEFRLKSWIPIRNDLFWASKSAQPMFKEQVSSLWSCNVRIAGNKPAQAREPIHDAKNCIKAACGSWEVHYKIHWHMLKTCAWIFNRVQQTTRFYCAAFVLLTNLTFLTKFQNRLKHILPIKTFLTSCQ